MNRNEVIMWLGRIGTLAFTIAVIVDMYGDATLSRELRTVVLSMVISLFVALCGWQGYIAMKYDGWPIIPLSFRWVVFMWLASFVIFIGWVLAQTYLDIYTDLRSAVVWWQFGTASLWFASRWVTVDAPHPAGAGETGMTPQGGGSPGA